MSISAQARADFAYNTTRDGDDVLLTDADGNNYPVKGWIRRTDMQSDPDTGAKILDPKTTITVPAETVSDIAETWTVEFVDANGETISGRVMSPTHDRTMRFLIFEVEIYGES